MPGIHHVFLIGLLYVLVNVFLIGLLYVLVNVCLYAPPTFLSTFFFTLPLRSCHSLSLRFLYVLVNVSITSYVLVIVFCTLLRVLVNVLFYCLYVLVNVLVYVPSTFLLAFCLRFYYVLVNVFVYGPTLSECF